MLQELLQLAVLRTQRAPFLTLYRAHYEATIAALAARLERVPGFVALYLIGSMTDDPLYGLSDIDLAVVTERSEAHAEVYRIHSRLKALARVLAPANEIGVWDLETLRQAFETFPFYQYRYGDPRQRRLVAGRDVLVELTPSFELAARLEARLLMHWDGLRAQLIEGTDAGPAAGLGRAAGAALHRRFMAYYWHKLLADLLCFGLTMDGGAPALERSQLGDVLASPGGQAALERLLPALEQRAQIVDVVARRGPERAAVALAPDRGLVLFHALLRGYFTARARRDGPMDGERAQLTVVHGAPPSEGLPAADPTASWRLSLVPACCFDRDPRGLTVARDGAVLSEQRADPLRLELHDRWICWAHYQALPDVEALRALTREAARRGALDLIVEVDGVGLSLLQPRSPWAVVSERTHPELFALARRAPDDAAPVALPVRRAAEILSAYQVKLDLAQRALAGAVAAEPHAELRRLLRHGLDASFALGRSTPRALELCASSAALREHAAAMGLGTTRALAGALDEERRGEDLVELGHGLGPQLALVVPRAQLSPIAVVVLAAHGEQPSRPRADRGALRGRGVQREVSDHPREPAIEVAHHLLVAQPQHVGASAKLLEVRGVARGEGGGARDRRLVDGERAQAPAHGLEAPRLGRIVEGRAVAIRERVVRGDQDVAGIPELDHDRRAVQPGQAAVETPQRAKEVALRSEQLVQATLGLERFEVERAAVVGEALWIDGGDAERGEQRREEDLGRLLAAAARGAEVVDARPGGRRRRAPIEQAQQLCMAPRQDAPPAEAVDPGDQARHAAQRTPGPGDDLEGARQPATRRRGAAHRPSSNQPSTIVRSSLQKRSMVKRPRTSASWARAACWAPSSLSRAATRATPSASSA